MYTARILLWGNWGLHFHAETWYQFQNKYPLLRHALGGNMYRCRVLSMQIINVEILSGLLLGWYGDEMQLQWRKGVSQVQLTSIVPSVSSILGYMKLALVAVVCCSKYPLHTTQTKGMVHYSVSLDTISICMRMHPEEYANLYIVSINFLNPATSIRLLVFNTRPGTG